MPTGLANRLMPSLRRVVLGRQSAARTDGELLGAFVNERDADAFAELVRRHGPMVLGVCRRVVNEHATADDAFQAVFLVLARRAASVRPREQVGNWLYGVAYRTALKARMVLARRRSREKQVDTMPEPTAPSSSPVVWTDLQPVIDEELARLPDKLRLPVVLCDLEGRPQREVAKHLNVPPATLATRLASARRTLATRLTRRGVTLSGGALAGLLGTHAAASAVPHTLATGVVRAVEAIAAGGAVNSLVSAHAIQLSEGVMRMMMLAKLKAVAVVAVTALALTTGLGLGVLPASAGEEPAAPDKATAKPAPAAQPETINKHLAARLKDQAQADPTVDDATFLRRLCLDVRGTSPTDVEMWFFTSDEDNDKRVKVIEWMTDDDAVRIAIAKKLGVPPERIKIVRAKVTADGKQALLLAYALDATTTAEALNTALSSFDQKLLVVQGKTTVQDQKTAKENHLYAVIDTDTARLKTTRLHVTGKQSDAQQGYTRRLVNLPADEVVISEGQLFLTDLAAEQTDHLWVWVTDDGQPKTREMTFTYRVSKDSDAEFLKRVLTDTRGGEPTVLELKYFTEDKDPKKREKLLDTLLKDPAVQKRLGDEWKKKMLAPPAGKAYFKDNLHLVPGTYEFQYTPKVQPNPPAVPPKPPVPPTPPTPPTPQVDRLEKLVGELIAAKKSDAEMLEAITLATLGRLPTDSEKKLTMASISKATDRKAAWVAVAKALAGSDEAKKPEGSKFKLKVEPVPPVPPTPPVPPVPPKP